MTCTKVAIVMLVVAVGTTEVNPANWVPFAPSGWTSVVSTSTLVFFAYVGFDAVANTAEEAKNPQVRP
jgi:APA family basic amino acid/polyamine antiporter